MRLRIIILLATIVNIINAQGILSVDDAVSISLKNNFDIRIARSGANIDSVNNTPGNAGMLPELYLNASGNYQMNSAHQELSDGSVNNYNSITGSSASASAVLSWTLFDGGKMFVTKNKLNEIQSLGELRFKDRVLQTLYDVIAAYYNVVRQKQQLNSINEVMNYNNERVKIAQTGFNAGSLLKTDLLQAKIDLNVTMENAINQQYVIIEAKKTLNRLLGRDTDMEYEVSDTIGYYFNINKDNLVQQIDSVNTTIQSLKKQVDIARLSVKEMNRQYSPTLNFHAGYYTSLSNKLDPSALHRSVYGPQLGGTLSIPLYSAGENKRKISVAKIELESAEYDLQNVSLQVNTALKNALTDYENQQKLLQLEQENNELTRENLEISLHRLRLGQTTSLEVHQAQESFVQSNTRLINFQYNLKIAETKLRQLSANL